LYYYGKGQRKQAKFQLEKARTMTTDATRLEEIDKLLANLEPQKKKKAEHSGRRKR
jgi:hypothetical protein